jgi:uncharacterized protein
MEKELRSECKIPFVGLKLGKHTFTFLIENSFFDTLGIQVTDLLVSRGNLEALIVFDKQQENIFHLDIKVEGNLVLNCERCLDDFEYELKFTERQWVKIGDADFDDPDILTLPKNEFQLDVGPLLYEFISLAVPLIRMHPRNSAGDRTCSNETSEVIKSFEYLDSSKSTDPRWEVLNNLKNKID